MYEKMNKSVAIIITITAMVLMVPIIFPVLEPPSVKAEATWPMTSEIDGKIPPASTAARVPKINRK